MNRSDQSQWTPSSHSWFEWLKNSFCTRLYTTISRSRWKQWLDQMICFDCSHSRSRSRKNYQFNISNRNRWSLIFDWSIYLCCDWKSILIDRERRRSYLIVWFSLDKIIDDFIEFFQCFVVQWCHWRKSTQFLLVIDRSTKRRRRKSTDDTFWFLDVHSSMNSSMSD